MHTLLFSEEGRQKTWTAAVHLNFIAPYISIHTMRKSIKSINSEVLYHRKNLID